MELKLEKGHDNMVAPNCSNRTFMELKLPYGMHTNVTEYSSNRTFMELKPRSWSLLLWVNLRSNRTLMELKHVRGGVAYVLIVPLWNWNLQNMMRNCILDDSSNRTLMELKPLCVQHRASELPF